MSDVYVSHLTSALGSSVQSVEQAEAAGQLVSPAAALRSAGFGFHHVCNDSESSYALAARALAESNIDAAAVDVIVYSTCLAPNATLGDTGEFERSRDVKHLTRFPASALQAEFGMHGAFIVGLHQQACTGMLGALRIGRNMLRAEECLQRVLCITADRFPPCAKYEQAYNLISDGAAACLLTRQPHGFRLLDVHHISNGAMADASDAETAGSYFNYSSRLIHEALARTGLALAEIRWVVPQNINRTAMKILCQLLNLEPGRLYCPSLATAGHVISADNVINLQELCASEQLRSGDKVLTFMAGYGSNWQSAILEAV